MKTIINAIQARHERTQLTFGSDFKRTPERVTQIIHKDRQALLDIISEIGDLLDEPPIKGNIVEYFGGDRGVDIELIKAIINRTEP